MNAARLTVSRNIRALMDNSVPKVSQTLIGDVIELKQPQVSQRLQGRQPWGIDELEQIAEFFGVAITLLVDSDENAVYRWLAENGRIDLRDKRISPSNWNPTEGPFALRLFDPDGPDVVIDLRDHIVNNLIEAEPFALLADAS